MKGLASSEKRPVVRIMPFLARTRPTIPTNAGTAGRATAPCPAVYHNILDFNARLLVIQEPAGELGFPSAEPGMLREARLIEHLHPKRNDYRMLRSVLKLNNWGAAFLNDFSHDH